MSPDQQAAFRKIPDCVDLDQLERGNEWSHAVFRVEHPVEMRISGEDSYTLREARACQKWLAKYAPESAYAKLPPR